MNNSISGKTMEIIGNSVDIKLTTDDTKAVKLFSKLHFKSSILIDGLHLVEFYKQEVEYNKPLYLGTTILDLSKLHLMKFHVNSIQNNFADNFNMLYHDTDSLVYNIKHLDI